MHQMSAREVTANWKVLPGESNRPKLSRMCFSDFLRSLIPLLCAYLPLPLRAFVQVKKCLGWRRWWPRIDPERICKNWGILRCHSLEWWTSWIDMPKQRTLTICLEPGAVWNWGVACHHLFFIYVTIWTKRTKRLVHKKLQPRSLGYVGWDKTASSWGMYTCT